MVGRPRDGWVIFWTMTALFIVGLLVCNWAETNAHPALANHVVGGNMEGKEVRFGTGGSALRRGGDLQRRHRFLQLNAIDSFQPLGVAVPLLNMLHRRNRLWRARDRTLQHDLRRADSTFVGGLNDRPHARASWETNWPARDENYRSLYAVRSGHCVGANGDLLSLQNAGLAGLTTNTGAHGFTEITFCLRKRFCQQRSEHGGSQRQQYFL